MLKMLAILTSECLSKLMLQCHFLVQWTCGNLSIFFYSLTEHPHITGHGEASEVNRFRSHPFDR